MKQIPINIFERDNLLCVKSDVSIIGSERDNEAQEFVFTRPDDYADHDLLLLFKDFNGNTGEANIGTENTYTILNSLMQTRSLTVQIAFLKGSDYREGSDILQFDVRISLSGGDVPEPLPSTLTELENRAAVDGEYDDESAAFRYFNLTGSETFSIPFSPSGVTDFNVLTNKPQIESVTLQGNRSLEEIGVAQVSNEQILKLF